MSDLFLEETRKPSSLIGLLDYKILELSLSIQQTHYSERS